MKLTVILLIASLAASAHGRAQTVTLSLKNVPIQKVFKEVSRQTGISIVYPESQFKNLPPVTIRVKNATVEEVMNQCLAGQPFTYIMEGNLMEVKPKPKPAATSQPSSTEALAKVDPIDIRGRVTNEQGDPIEGATVSVKGTNKVTATDSNGEFQLTGISENATLVITGVSIESREVRVGGKTELAITAVTKVTSMNEVVINKGYYTEKQRLSVSNVGKITAKDIEMQAVNNPILALQGKIPGIVISQANGLAGGAVRIRIQGQNSLASGNDPLIVIDGVPYPTELPAAVVTPLRGSGELQGNSESALSYLNPADVESIEVLKDADATAIYGSRAANGAILITTKKGKAGKTKIDANIQQGWGSITRKTDVLNKRQYLDMRYEAFKNDGITPTASNARDLMLWDTTRQTDWQDVLIGGTAEFTNINLGISGGNQGIQYRVNGSWRKETTVFPGSFSDQKGSMHFNLNNSNVNERFHFQVSSTYTVDDNRLPANDFTRYAVLLPPIAPPLYSPDGTLNWAQDASGSATWTNPLGNTVHQTYQTNSKVLVANTNLSYGIMPGLEIGSNFGYTNLKSADYALRSLFALRPEQRNSNTRQAFYGDREINTWIIEPQISYNVKIGKGQFDMLLGTTFQSTKSQMDYLSGSGYINDLVLKDIRSAASIVATTTSDILYKYNAGFGRLNYNWKDKYIINATARRDGSSRFGEKNKFHNFAAAGVGWIFSNENVFQHNISFLSFGKLRANYGTTGSDQIGDYSFLELYNTINPGIPYQGTTGLNIGGFSNPYLQWEETKKLSVGLDLGFINERVLINTTYGRNRSSNQLVNYLLPAMTGNQSVRRNFQATVENISWEFSLTTINISTKKFNWNSNINLTIPRNKLIDFPNLESSPYASTLVIGEPINVQKGYHFIGVDPMSGLYLVADKHGNPTSTPDANTDRKLMITTFPQYSGGFQNNFSFKGFQLSLLLHFVKQKGPSNIFRLGTVIPGALSFDGLGNQPITVVNRWQKFGDISNVQKYSTNNSAVSASLNNALSSDAGVSDDASYGRLRNLYLSWDLPERWNYKTRLKKCKFYVQGQNLLTITDYRGADPENQSFTSLPPLKILAIGLQVTL